MLNVDSSLTNSKHGIEFGYVGGDPAELMRICVENGTFTIAFLREGVTKVGSLQISATTFVLNETVPRVD